MAKATGVWAARSVEGAVIYLDVDNCALLRQAGSGRAPAHGSGRWMPLVRVERYLHRAIGVVKVGDRHRYVYDHDTDSTDYAWWIQACVTAIERVSGDLLAPLPRRLNRPTTSRRG